MEKRIPKHVAKLINYKEPAAASMIRKEVKNLVMISQYSTELKTKQNNLTNLTKITFDGIRGLLRYV